jgi:mannose-6-phosphate isomerase-like protein (cupin superfamily)
MIIRDHDFQIISKNSNAEYYSGDIYPDWTPIAGIHDFPVRPMAGGVEPHYHDNDEFWFWATGRGEVWLDGKNIPVGPNTVTYTPMGVVHKFLMHTDFEVVAVITKAERRKRIKHILVEEDGPPVPTVPGFVVSGEINTGPFPDRGPRCPLSELRLVTLDAGQGIPQGRVPVNEHWLVLSGQVELHCGGRDFELHAGDVALVRASGERRIRATRPARLVLLRE